MDYKSALDYLYSFKESDIKLGLGRVEDLLGKLGNPHHCLRVLHVAGTNGKGSVCAMLDFILQEQGYKVGRYTSPHLIQFNERIMVNNKQISDKDLSRLISKIRPLVREHTFFEIVTAMAFLYFKEQEVDYVVCEVGLGGRLDATNIANPLVSIITSISIEHAAYLGNTVKEIAWEKAGIIKQNIPAITAEEGEALEVIKKVCKDKNSELTVVKKPYDGKINLKGDFQKINAALAIAALEKSGIKISRENITKGLEKVVWPGRFELRGNVLYDCAHNPGAFRMLVNEIKKLKYGKLVLVIGILKDKKIDEIMGLISPLADRIIITKPKIHRAQEPSIIAEYADKDCLVVEDVKEAVRKAKSLAGEEDLAVVTGSIFVVGEALS